MTVIEASRIRLEQLCTESLRDMARKAGLPYWRTMDREQIVDCLCFRFPLVVVSERG